MYTCVTDTECVQPAISPRIRSWVSITGEHRRGCPVSFFPLFGEPTLGTPDRLRTDAATGYVSRNLKKSSCFWSGPIFLCEASFACTTLLSSVEHQNMSLNFRVKKPEGVLCRARTNLCRGYFILYIYFFFFNFCHSFHCLRAYSFFSPA